MEAHLGEMSGAGFRTLVLGYKDLSTAEFDAWAAGYKAACAAMTVRRGGEGGGEGAAKGGGAWVQGVEELGLRGHLLCNPHHLTVVPRPTWNAPCNAPTGPSPHPCAPTPGMSQPT